MLKINVIGFTIRFSSNRSRKSNGKAATKSRKNHVFMQFIVMSLEFVTTSPFWLTNVVLKFSKISKRKILNQTTIFDLFAHNDFQQKHNLSKTQVTKQFIQNNLSFFVVLRVAITDLDFLGMILKTWKRFSNKKKVQCCWYPNNRFLNF